MAIRDLLWACPECGREGGIRREDGKERCPSCEITFRRGPGSIIVAEGPAGELRAAPAEEWLDRLPDLEVFPEGQGAREARVVARFAGRDVPIRREGRFLGFREGMGEKVPGTLVLQPDRLTFRAEGGETHSWPFERITGLQPSSRTLQVKARGEPVVGFRFPEASPRFWEELLEEALRAWYREEGRGEIREFQPRIATR